MGFDEGWEYDAGYEAEFDSEFDADYGAEDLYLSLLPDEERQRFWSESIWSDPIDEDFRMDSLLFTHRGSEAELSREIRLSELWGACQGRPFTMDEIPRNVRADLRGGRNFAVPCPRTAPCWDAPMQVRTGHWPTTLLCRGHLRFRLGHAEIDGGGTHRARSAGHTAERP